MTKVKKYKDEEVLLMITEEFLKNIGISFDEFKEKNKKDFEIMTYQLNEMSRIEHELKTMKPTEPDYAIHQSCGEYALHDHSVVFTQALGYLSKSLKDEVALILALEKI